MSDAAEKKGNTVEVQMSFKELRAEYELARAQNAELAAANATLTKRLADAEAALAHLGSKPTGVEAYVLKTRLTHNDVRYEAGAELPFDPKNPPHGCNGLVEGEHYEKARVIVRAAN